MTATPPTRVNVHDLPKSGVRVIAPNAPEFDGQARSVLGAKHNALTDRALPYSIVLKNESGKRIIMHTVMYKWPANNREGWGTRRVILESMTGDNECNVEPGETRLVSPSNSLKSDSPPARAMTTSAEAFPNTLDAAARVEIVLDSVLFEDGTFIGQPDSTMFAFVNAIRNQRIKVYSAALSAPNAEQMRATLTALSHDNSIGPDETARDIRHRQANAKILLQLPQHANFSMFKQSLAAALATEQAKPRIHK